MNTRLLLIALSASTLFAVGCKNKDCDRAFGLKNDLMNLRTTLTGTIADSNLTPNTCSQIQRVWNKKLAQATEFTQKIAYRRFYKEKHRCLYTRNETRCGYWNEPTQGIHNNGRIYDCRTVTVCDQEEVTPTIKPGFTESLVVAHLLPQMKASLAGGCKASSVSASRANFNEALKITLRAHEQTEQVLGKAGCYK